jgi:hypothetical protein
MACHALPAAFLHRPKGCSAGQVAGQKPIHTPLLSCKPDLRVPRWACHPNTLSLGGLSSARVFAFPSSPHSTSLPCPRAPRSTATSAFPIVPSQLNLVWCAASAGQGVQNGLWGRKGVTGHAARTKSVHVILQSRVLVGWAIGSLVTRVMPLAALLYKAQLGPAFGYIAGPPGGPPPFPSISRV